MNIQTGLSNPRFSFIQTRQPGRIQTIDLSLYRLDSQVYSDHRFIYIQTRHPGLYKI